jgi:ABC-type nitrate/sulfonate/bicarbonate transport system substrate-binding protein
LTALLPAAKAGQVDGFIFGPPLTSMPVAGGWGQVWVDFTNGEVSGVDEAPFGVMIAKREDLTKKAEQARRVISALRLALKDINENPELVKKVVKPAFFEKVDDAVFNIAFTTLLKNFRHNLTASQEGYQQTLKTMKVIDQTGKPVVVPYDKAFDFSLIPQVK